MQEIAQKALDSLSIRVKCLFNLDINLSLAFDLKGICTIGQCKKISKKNYLIRLHLPLYEAYKDIYLDDVLTHEVAHAVQMELFKSKVKPHGKEWIAIMETLEEKKYIPRQRPKYTSYLKTKKSKKRSFLYTCDCKTNHNLSVIRHNRIKKGILYKCMKCNSFLKEA